MTVHFFHVSFGDGKHFLRKTHGMTLLDSEHSLSVIKCVLYAHWKTRVLCALKYARYTRVEIRALKYARYMRVEIRAYMHVEICAYMRVICR